MKSFDTSPQGYARLAGVIYLVIILFGMASEGLVLDSMVVSGDVAATARNITASPDLWRLSAAGDLIVPLIAVVQLWIEYYLFRPVSRMGAMLFLLFNAASLAVEAVSKVFLLMVAPAIHGAGTPAGTDQNTIYALVGFALSAHNLAFHIALILFGCACLVSGWLIFRSGYIARLVGVLMQLAGAAYLIASFSRLFFPTFADLISPWILLPPLVGESSFCLWLLVRGVDLERWNARVDYEGEPALG